MEHILQLLHYACSFFVVLSVIVFVHEFGHYIVAKWSGVKIEAFSIGFGKELFGWTDRSGTRWKVSLVPMGGYVKMYGDGSAASTPDAEKAAVMTDEEKAISFHHKPLHKKAAVVVAGPVFNFLLTIVILTGLIMMNGISSTAPVVGDILPESSAAEAGLKTGDRILSVDGKEVKVFNDIPGFIATNLGTPVSLRILRDGQEETLTLSPRMTEDQDAFGNTVSRPLLGIKSQPYEQQHIGFFGAIGEAVKRTIQICEMTLKAVSQIITGDRSAKELKGPIGIAQLSGQATQMDFVTVLWFIALLSANLGLVNLFPIPLLDGGHLMYYAIEAVRGKPLAEKVQDYGFRLGFAVVAMLMVFAIFNDLRNIF
ncbi:MAG: RIP metalloprotease RseP [Alphaproteobacteria bacterium]|nr:RIP metalloprotease RseP [Alphaproteobacteria bacterium]